MYMKKRLALLRFLENMFEFCPPDAMTSRCPARRNPSVLSTLCLKMAACSTPTHPHTQEKRYHKCVGLILVESILWALVSYSLVGTVRPSLSLESDCPAVLLRMMCPGHLRHTNPSEFHINSRSHILINLRTNFLLRLGRPASTPPTASLQFPSRQPVTKHHALLLRVVAK